jgi:hypothetical protein
MRWLALSSLLVLTLAGFAFGSGSPAFTPPCPHLTYSPDGNVSPLFCVIVNPDAWRFYDRVAPRMLALPRSASPGEVVAAAAADRSHSHATPPEECSAFKLWARATGFSAPGFLLYPPLC